MSECFIQPSGLNPHECGYCKVGGDTSISFGFSCDEMYVDLYEKLMLKGWRRSGNYFYRAINHLTCCPMYTIRLAVREFQPSKSQKKVLKQASKYFENRNLDISLVEASFTDEKYLLYKKYQMMIHGDEEGELSPSGFERFLVISPLRSRSDATSCFGTFHQEYRCDGVLFAVGVLDVLPSGLSSVYFFYDPDMKSLGLGKYSALNEIQYSQNNNFNYYYMGFYIHQCEKMKYKGEYKPSELLCPVSHNWYFLADVLGKLERYAFTPFDELLFQRREALQGNSNSDSLGQLYPKPPPANTVFQIPILISRFEQTVKLSELDSNSKKIMSKILLDLLHSTFGGIGT